jgi:trimeric autotransporter adhesin
MSTRMQQRRGTAAQWISTNSGNGPILAPGEIGFESDTNKFKIGDGVNHWVNLTYFTDAAELADIIDGAPAALNTLNEIAAAINDDPAFFTTIATNLSNHESDTTNVHGIADTAELATKAFAASLLTGATKTNITITGDKTGLTITAENGVADSNTDNLTEGSTNKYFTDERAQDAVGNSVGTGLSYNDSTGAISVDTTAIQARVADVSDTEIGYLNGVTSAIQTQIDSKAPLASPTFTGTVTLPTGTVTSGMILDGTIVDADINASAAIAQSKIDGLTTALSAKAPLADPTFTGTVSGVTKTHVGLGNVDNTSDANKPVSTATQTALDLKANLSGPTFTGTTTTDHLVVDGDFTINGTNFAASATSITIEDNIVQIAHQNPANTVDLGIVVGYNDGTAKHAGLVKDTSANTWKLFKGVTTEPATTVDFTQGSLDDLALAGLTASSITVGDVSNTEFGYLNGVTGAIQTQLDDKQPKVTGVSDTEIGYLDGVTSAIQTQLNAKLDSSTASTTYAPLASPTFTGTVTIPNGAALGTPASGTLTNATGLPVSGIVSSTSTALGLGSIELGHATDTTISRASAGRAAIEGVNIVTTSSSDTLTNKTLSAAILTGTLTAGGGVGTSGQLLSSTATGVQWVNAPTGYLAPTLGSTSIASGATVTTIAGLTLTAPTLTGTVTASGDINLSAVGGPGSVVDEFAIILMDAL